MSKPILALLFLISCLPLWATDSTYIESSAASDLTTQLACNGVSAVTSVTPRAMVTTGAVGAGQTFTIPANSSRVVTWYSPANYPGITSWVSTGFGGWNFQLDISSGAASGGKTQWTATCIYKVPASGSGSQLLQTTGGQTLTLDGNVVTGMAANSALSGTSALATDRIGIAMVFTNTDTTAHSFTARTASANSLILPAVPIGRSATDAHTLTATGGVAALASAVATLTTQGSAGLTVTPDVPDVALATVDTVVATLTPALAAQNVGPADVPTGSSWGSAWGQSAWGGTAGGLPITVGTGPVQTLTTADVLALTKSLHVALTEGLSTVNSASFLRSSLNTGLTETLTTVATATAIQNNHLQASDSVTLVTSTTVTALLNSGWGCPWGQCGWGTGGFNVLANDNLTTTDQLSRLLVLIRVPTENLVTAAAANIGVFRALSEATTVSSQVAALRTGFGQLTESLSTVAAVSRIVAFKITQTSVTTSSASRAGSNYLRLPSELLTVQTAVTSVAVHQVALVNSNVTTDVLAQATNYGRNVLEDTAVVDAAVAGSQHSLGVGVSVTLSTVDTLNLGTPVDVLQNLSTQDQVNTGVSRLVSQSLSTVATAGLGFSAQVQQTLAVSEALTTALTRTLSSSVGASLTTVDAVVATGVHSVGLSETHTTIGLANIGPGISKTESLTTTSTAFPNFRPTVIQTLAVADALTVTANRSQTGSVSQSLATAATVNFTVARVVATTVTLSTIDVVTPTASRGGLVVNLTTTDTVARSAALGVAASQLLSATITVSANVGGIIQIQESLNPLDQVAAVSVRAQAVSTSLSTADSAVSTAARAVTLTETITESDAAVMVVAHVGLLTETLVTTDNLSGSASLVRSRTLGETLTMVDTSNEAASLASAVASTVVNSDQTTANVGRQVLTATTVSESDAAATRSDTTGRVTVVLPPADALSISLALAGARAMQETLPSLADVVTTGSGRGFTVAICLTTADVVTAARTASASFTEVTSTTSAVIAVAGFSPQLLESVPVQDLISVGTASTSKGAILLESLTTTAQILINQTTSRAVETTVTEHDFASTGPGQVLVADTLFDFNGHTVSGVVTITNPQAFVSADGYLIVAGTVTTRRFLGGLLAMPIVPNAAGTVYQALYQLSGGVSFNETWTVLGSSPLTLAQVRTPVAPTPLCQVQSTLLLGSTSALSTTPAQVDVLLSAHAVSGMPAVGTVTVTNLSVFTSGDGFPIEPGHKTFVIRKGVVDLKLVPTQRPSPGYLVEYQDQYGRRVERDLWTVPATGPVLSQQCAAF